MENLGVDRDSIQVVNREGRFDVTALKKFAEKVKLDQCGISYGVASIIGSQSSGKSTLLNHLFSTKFSEMDARIGRSQTTRGIWLSKAGGSDPLTLVMDMEGTDGIERGEDDTTFEKQAALFALAVSDTVIINMWCHEIGREQAANRPLLRIVFQVMMRIFDPRRINLMFVVRDKAKKTPVEWYESMLREDIQKIWDAISKPQEQQDTPLSELFNVEVFALSNYEHEEEQFKKEVLVLRERLLSALHARISEDQRIPASGFALSSQRIWNLIKQNKDLDQPAHSVMVAMVRCSEIANGQYSMFATGQEWHCIEVAAQAGPVPGFGKKLIEMIKSSLSGYDSEAKYFDEQVRSEKRNELEGKLLLLVRPAIQLLIGHTQSSSLEKFKRQLQKSLLGGDDFSRTADHYKQLFMAQFAEECAELTLEQVRWDTSAVRAKLQCDIDSYIVGLREAKCCDIVKRYEDRVNYALTEPLEVHLAEANDRTWVAIKELLHRVTESAVSEYSRALSSYELNERAKETLCNGLRERARLIVEEKARAKAAMVLISMKRRLVESLNGDLRGTTRAWTGKEDIELIISNAFSSVLELLSVMAAIRLDNETDDYILLILFMSLLNPENTDQRNDQVDRLESLTWEKVPASKTLITPPDCRRLWMQFMSEAEDSVTKARAAWEDAKKRRMNRLIKGVGQKVLAAAALGMSIAGFILGVDPIIFD